MKKGRKVLLAVLLTALLVLSGCGKYTSSYKAVGFVHNNTSESAFMDFYLFEGTMVFKLRNSTEGAQILYDARLETGRAVVYYDCGTGSVPLFTINGGETFSTEAGELAKGTVYLIVETENECVNGSFHFGLE